MSSINWFEKYAEIFDLIEDCMINLDLWSVHKPSEQALASTMPFAVDTLSLEQWLQFIFLPRMREMLDNEQLPPGPAQIAPIAEEVFKKDDDKHELIKLMKKFDEISHVSHLH
ncbi:MAG: YqcC family protein [Kangiellaceae bacterium]|nr:YqcC family protein [Kangiellaceae bacterium]